ncbi:nitrate- and nitrite sensing domain-containing protein [Streptomyces sp. NPDC046197]|uniref:sensor histidine kinase n=1 Tax=Streptomyces sp. NPDC046197 TaxID=3154337 RepID=UPI0033D419E0
MRAPVQKTRLRRTGKQTASAGGAQQTPVAPPVGKGRPTHVRNRLIAAVAVVAAAVAGAGAPSVIAASGQLSDSQDLVTLAGQTEDALALAHSLADERDEVTSYVAAGRPRSKAPSEQRSTRVDRQVDELRANPDTPAWLRTDLDGIAAVRRAALTGQSTALQAHQAYSAPIAELHRLAEQLAEQMPPRAGSGAHALAELDTAVQQAAAARGLLLAALNVPYSTQTVISPTTGLPTTTATSSDADTKQRAALSAAAQQARVRSDAALTDFRDTAPETARASYDSTVTGPEVTSAEKYLAGLTDRPTLSDSDLNTSVRKADAALSARVDLMGGVESSLYDHRTKDLTKLRDDDVTALEIRIAVLGALLLAAIGIATALARTLTRPLAVLRLGSARLAGAEDPTAEEPLKFTGRNDEFAQVVRSVNALHAHAAALAERVATLEADRKHLVGQRQKMADAREELRAELAGSAAQLERLRTSIGSTFVNLALRTLGLVERQLAVIEGLEEREQDPDRLSTLFKLDHFATVMRRHSENLLVLAGTEHVQQHAGPVPLVDVVRAAVSEIERYERVRIAALPPHAHVAGFVADDLSHLLAELMENATSFSPPDRPVEVSGWLLENGEVMLSVQDEGIGMTTERMTRLNGRLAALDPEAPYDQEGEDGLGLGLYVVARLAHRHGVRVQLREQRQGGVAAVVVVPHMLLATPPAAAPASGGTQTFSLPGANAEANSNVLPGRFDDGDPLVNLAEQAVRRSETPPDHAPQPPQDLPQPTPGRAAPPAHDAPQPSPDRAAQPSEEIPQPGPDRVPQPTPEVRRPGHGIPQPTQDIAQPSPDRGAQPPQDLLQPGPDRAPQPAHGAERPAQDTPQPTPEVPQPGHRIPHQPAVGPEPVAERPAETTMELLLPALAPASEPDPARPHPASDAGPGHEGHAVADDGTAPQEPTVHQTRTGGAGAIAEGEAAAEHGRAPDRAEEPVTAKGLPKRTPRITAPDPAPRRPSGSVDADALRRRLGGFRQGAQAGLRAVEAEIAAQTDQHRTPAAQPAERNAEEATGGTVEEASS